MADASGKMVRIGDSAVGEVLRYLRDLGWDAVYQREPRAQGSSTAVGERATACLRARSSNAKTSGRP